MGLNLTQAWMVHKKHLIGHLFLYSYSIVGFQESVGRLFRTQKRVILQVHTGTRRLHGASVMSQTVSKIG